MKLPIVALSVLILAASAQSAATEPARIDLSITAIDVVADPLADYNVHVTPTVMTRIGEIVPGELLADIQVLINGIDFGSNVYRAKDFVEGLCWANQPPSCVDACPSILVWDWSIMLFNIVPGSCGEFANDCICAYEEGYSLPQPFQVVGQLLETCTVIIDPNNVIEEIDETNNEMTVALGPVPVETSTWSRIKAVYR